MPMKKLGLVALVLTLVLMIPLLFILSRNTVDTSQFILIVSAVLLFVLWTIAYATLIDPLLRRGVGALFGTTIEWRGTSKSISWTPGEETGCIASLLIDLLGYFFIILWLLPFGAGIALVLWWRH
jgi:hypothetical protein